MVARENSDSVTIVFRVFMAFLLRRLTSVSAHICPTFHIAFADQTAGRQTHSRARLKLKDLGQRRRAPPFHGGLKPKTIVYGPQTIVSSGVEEGGDRLLRKVWTPG